MKQKLLLKAMLLLCALVAGSSSAWASSNVSTVSTTFSATGDVTDKFTQTGDFTKAAWNLAVTWKNSVSWQALNADKGSQIGSGSNPATGIVLTGSSIPGTITSVVVNTSGASSVNATVAVTVGGTAFKCNNNTTASLTSSAANYEFTGSASGDVVVTWANSSSKALYIKSITTTYSTGSSSDPSISASNVNIAQDATNGSIEYSLSNATGNVSASITSGDWLTLGEITASAVPFTCSANTGAERTATVTLSFTGAPNKVVTITQAAKTVAAPDFNLEGNKRYWQGTEITLTSAGNTIYYNMTTDGSDPATPTSGSTLYSAPIVLGNNTAKIWAIAYDTYGNKSSVVKRTYTGVAPATLPFSWDEKETATTGIICSTGVSTYSSSPYLKISETGQNVILKFDGVPGTLAFDIKGNSFSGGTFKVQTSADGETYSDLEEYTSLGDVTTECFTTLASSVRYIKWIYTEKVSGNVALGNIRLISPVTISAYEWATYVTPCALDFTGLAGIKAYIVTGHNDGWTAIEKTQMTGKVPANTPLLLEGTTTNVPIAASSSTDVSANKLVAGTGASIAAADGLTRYVLGVEGGKATFLKIAGTAAAVPADKAYLEFTGSAPALASMLSLDIDDVTGINAVNGTDKVNGEYYNLAGQRVANPTKGLYIVNGKKVIVK